MGKKIEITIETPHDCIYYWIGMCTQTNDRRCGIWEVDNPSFPDWCPLEDAKDKSHD